MDTENTLVINMLRIEQEYETPVKPKIYHNEYPKSGIEEPRNIQENTN